MPVDYTGNKSLIRPPSGKPGPEETIILALPQDGDPPNASTVNQQNQVLADFVHWLMVPSSLPGEYAQHMRAYRDSSGRLRAAIDHFGFPMGKIAHFRDDLGGLSGAFTVNETTSNSRVTWGLNPAFDVDAAAIAKARPDWIYGCNKASANLDFNISTRDPDPAGPPVRLLGNSVKLRTGSTDGDKVGIIRTGGQKFLFDSTCVATLEWDANLDANGVNNNNCLATMGLGSLPNSSDFGADPDAGIYFRRSANSNWLATVKQSGGAAMDTDTLVAPNSAAFQRFKIAFFYSRALFFIDGALVADVSTNLPSATTLGYPFFGINRNTATAGDPSLYIGMPIVGAHGVQDNTSQAF